MKRSQKWLAKLALPYVAMIFTALPYNQRLSLILDRLLIIAEDS